VPSAPAQVDLRATYLNEENKTVSYANPENGQNLATDYSPTFTWKKADGATWYIVYVYGSTGQLLAKWYPSTSICGDVSCMVERPITLAGGSYTWWVQTYNSVGYGPWSVGNIFTADVQTTPKATTLFTNGLPNINAKTKPIFAWSKVSQAISYRLYVKGPSGLVLDQWLQAKDVCVGNYCSLVSPVTLASGDHTWWVQTYNFAGYGPWRSAPFKVQSALSAPTSLALKAGEPSTKPIYTWTEVSTATKYHLYVVGPTYVIDKWYDSWTICASGVCSVQNPTVLDGGEHTWSVMPYNSMVGYGLWGSGMFMATP
jgi:hypothetical protein